MKFGLKKYMTCGRVNLLLKKLESPFFKVRRRCKADKNPLISQAKGQEE